MSKEGLLKAWNLEELGGFGQDLALARTPTDILKRFSDSGEVGGKQKNQKPKQTTTYIYGGGGEKMEEGGARLEEKKKPLPSKYSSNLQIVVLNIPALKDQGKGRCSRMGV